MEFDFITEEERERLYDEVWTEPISTVAKRYKLSDNGLRRRLKKFDIPMPKVGYWNKIAAGKDVEKTRLPEVVGNTRRYVREYIIKYRKNYKELPDEELLKKDELCLLTDETKAYIRKMCTEVKIPRQLRNPHYLILDHQKEIIYRKHPEKRVGKTTHVDGHHELVNAVLPIHTSTSSYNRAYRILNTMIYTLENMESGVQIGYNLEKNEDEGGFFVMYCFFKFELKETIKKSNGKSVFELILRPRGFWNNEYLDPVAYKDSKEEALELQVNKIIYNMFVTANEIYCMDILSERKQHRQWEEYERQQKLKQMRQGTLEDIKVLEKAASDWEIAGKIRKFISAMREKIEKRPDENNQLYLKWIQWAEDKADWIDPINAKEDKILGRNKSIFEYILELNKNNK